MLGVIIASQLALSVWPRGWHWSERLVAAALAFPAVGSVLALVVGWLTGYWAK